MPRAPAGAKCAPRHRQQRNNHDSDGEYAEVLSHQRMAAEQRPGVDEQDHPQQAASHVVERKTARRHVPRAREKRRDRPHDRNEAGDDDGGAAPAGKEITRHAQIRFAQPSALNARQQPMGRCASDNEIDGIAENRRDNQHGHRPMDTEAGGGNGGAGQEQQRITGQKWGDDKACLGKHDRRHQRQRPVAVQADPVRESLLETMSRQQRRQDFHRTGLLRMRTDQRAGAQEDGGWYRVRTCDPCRVKAVLYR